MPDPCQVDFYVLKDPAASAELMACRLALMAWEKGNRILILAASETDAERLDNLMWEHPQGRFLPHMNIQQPGTAPVRIGTMAQLADAAGDVLINLTPHPVPRPERFNRLLEIVPANDTQLKASRDKFREYRKQGLKPVSHDINRN